MINRLERKLERGEAVEIDGISLHTPTCYDAADNGAFIVMDEGEMEGVECTVLVFDREQSISVSETYTAAPAACDMRPDGLYAVAATLKPDNRIYLFDVERETCLWSRANHEHRPAASKRPQISGVSFNEDSISVCTGGVEDYRLSMDGDLHDAYREERNRFGRLDDREEEAISFVNEYLDSDDVQQNLKALVELEVRMEDAFVRNNLPSLVPGIHDAIERHDVHRIDLTDPSAPESHQKLMSLGKRLLYEAGRVNSTALTPVLPMIETHLNHQPKQAIQSDVEQLRQIVPEWVDEKTTGEAGSNSCDIAPQGDERDASTSEDLLIEDQQKQEGCGCLSLMLISVSTGLMVFLFSL